jgi:serine phosphatase RsbU (regulator of sigma subunit)
MTTENRYRNFFRSFGKGMTSEEMSKLFNVETPSMYAFYVRSMREASSYHSNVQRFIAFCWNFFIAFLLKLSPARRLLYAVALFFFIWYLLDPSMLFAFYSFIILNFLLALEVAERLITKDELEVAREIQIDLQPETIQAPEGISIVAHSDAAHNVGGDYYDYVALADGSHILAIGDVAGKGISAALYMIKAQTALHLLARETNDCSLLLSRMNEYLRDQLKKNFFITLSLLHFTNDRRLTLYRAGHLPALHYLASDHTTTWLQPNGMALGLAGQRADASTPLFEARQIDFRAGDTILLYTDGVTESVNTFKQDYGPQRLASFLEHYGSHPAESLKALLIKELQLYSAGTALKDDMTFAIIQRTSS